MIFHVAFAWALLPLEYFVKGLLINFENSKVPETALFHSFSEDVLRGGVNLIPLLRLMKSGVRGLIQYYEEGCSSRSYETFLNIRSLILKFPMATQLLLTPQCYMRLGDSVKARYNSDPSNVIKDFNDGLLGVYPNPIISDLPINKWKFVSLLEKFDPNAYIPSTEITQFKDLIKVSDSNLLPRAAEIQRLLLPYFYQTIGKTLGSLDEFRLWGWEQIISSLCNYAEQIFVEDSLAFFVIYSSFNSLAGGGEENEELFADASRIVNQISKNLYAPQNPSKFYLLLESLKLSTQYPYGEEHFAVRRELNKLQLGCRMLMRYATILANMTETPFETCRFFLGMNNIRKILASRDLLRHKCVHLCLTGQEFILYHRRWLSRPSDGGGPVDNFQNEEEFFINLANYYHNNYAFYPTTIRSEPGKVAFRRSIIFLIGKVNSHKDIITIRSVRPGNNTIKFPLSALHNDRYRVRMVALINLIVALNVHFDFSWSLEKEILDEIFDSLTKGDFQGEQLEALGRLIWIFNLREKYSDTAIELAKQINWDLDT